VGAGHVKKTVNSILATRVETAVEEDEDDYDNNQDDEFEYESDPKDSNIINLGNWDRK
jgi:hypothetical protein